MTLVTLAASFLLPLFTVVDYSHDEMVALSANFRIKVNAACSCEIDYFRVHDWNNPATWTVKWPGGVTDTQRQAGLAAIRAFDVKDLANRTMP